MKSAILTQYLKDVPQHIIDAELERIGKEPVSDIKGLNWCDCDELEGFIQDVLGERNDNYEVRYACGDLGTKYEDIPDGKYHNADYTSQRFFFLTNTGWELLGLEIWVRNPEKNENEYYDCFDKYFAPSEKGLEYMKKIMIQYYKKEIQSLNDNILKIQSI